jgi:mono/diheme cytochrome c family protein
MTRIGVAAGVLALSLLAGCGPSEPAPAPPPPAPAAPAARPAAAVDPEAARAEAENVFATRCTTCHGPQGLGDGPGAVSLNPKPRNFQDPAWQASVDDEYLTKIVLYGGAAVGRSPMMPGNPDLTGKPAVVAALVEHVRALKKP